MRGVIAIVLLALCQRTVAQPPSDSDEGGGGGGPGPSGAPMTPGEIAYQEKQDANLLQQGWLQLYSLESVDSLVS